MLDLDVKWDRGENWIKKNENKTNPDLIFHVWSENVVQLTLLDVGRPTRANPTWEGAERLVHSVRTASWRLMRDIGLLLTSKTTTRLFDATLTINNHLIHLAVITLIHLNPTCLSNHEHRGIGMLKVSHHRQNAIPFRHKSILMVKVLFFEKSHIKHYQTTFSGWLRDAHALMLEEPISSHKIKQFIGSWNSMFLCKA